ncbi:MAG: mycothiol synthase [Actinobacteria bacterium]|nr:mycothiol synthase [Actinomycetota bacterium]
MRWQLSVGSDPDGRLADVVELAGECAAVDRAEPFSDASVLAVSSAVRYVWAYEGDSDQLAGVAIVDGEMVEAAVRPPARGCGIGAALLAASFELGARRTWAHGNLPAARRLAAHYRATVARRLKLLRLPAGAIETGPPRLPPGFRLRHYAGSSDDAALLRVNRAAFADLPDQGGWSPADLTSRISADWFRAEDLLLLIDADTDALAGFHWTKVHPGGDCEVYVVALDPEYQGRGLAAELTRAGLRHLADLGCSDVMLYVDSTNTRALKVYRRLGFTEDREDILYVTQPVPASDPVVWQG